MLSLKLYSFLVSRQQLKFIEQNSILEYCMQRTELGDRQKGKRYAHTVRSDRCCTFQPTRLFKSFNTFWLQYNLTALTWIQSRNYQFQCHSWSFSECPHFQPLHSAWRGGSEREGTARIQKGMSLVSSSPPTPQFQWESLFMLASFSKLEEVNRIQQTSLPEAILAREPWINKEWRRSCYFCFQWFGEVMLHC